MDDTSSDVGRSADAASSLVSLDPIARSQAEVLRNLFELYVHDFGKLVPHDLHANGRFDVPIDDVWWNGDTHHPYFIRRDGKLCGFALARRGSRTTGDAEVMDVAEFFVVRGARGQKVGSSAAHALFGAFPGRWEVRVRAANAAALRFWERAAQTWIGRAVEGERLSVDRVEWVVFRIEPRR
jgi:predicted acetyltransferase